MKTAVLILTLAIPVFSAQAEPVLSETTQYSGQMFTSQKVARKIMGKNYFGVEDAIKYFKINPSREEIAGLSEVPFSEATLKKCAKTHILVAVFPMSILEIRKVVRKVVGVDIFYGILLSGHDLFVAERGGASWYLVRKTEVPNSTSKNWSEQLALLGKNEDAPSFSVESNSTAKSAGGEYPTIGKDEQVPSARVMVYTIIGHYLATNERLFDRIYVRCVDVNSYGLYMHIGGFLSNGLSVSYDPYVDHKHPSLGLSSAHRKFR